MSSIAFPKREHLSEFLAILDEAQKLFEEYIVELGNRSELLQPIYNMFGRELFTCKDLKQAILALANLLEESPIQIFIMEEQASRKEALTEDEKLALIDANRGLDTSKEQRQLLIQRLIRLNEKVEGT